MEPISEELIERVFNEDKNFDSPEFASLIKCAYAADDNDEHWQLLKKAYLLVRRVAPWAETAGKMGAKMTINPQFDSGGIFFTRFDMRELRRDLKERGLLDDEASSE